ncbi:MAG: TIM barrel protein [Desulfobacteraceae bacterium]|jgi:sugar phosphate isomerase/epimerase
MPQIQRLLNFSTHAGDLDLIENDWTIGRKILENWEFDGFEIYPVGNYPYKQIPAEIVGGLHLRFFVILAPIWREDNKRLLEIFGSWENVDHFYGGRDAQWVTDFYTRQLDMAHYFNCAYVVFHPVHCELENVYDWQFPWKLEETLDLCAEVINASVASSAFDGLLLFENLWWPGSFRLDNLKEYEYLLSRVDYPNCGIALDTGHMLNKNPQLADERQAIDYLCDCVDNLGEIARHIHTVHLSKSLSGEYIRKTQKMSNPLNKLGSFWEKFDLARRHVDNIDCHEPFESSYIATFLGKIKPAHVVYEFSFNSMVQWQRKIAIQKRALQRYLWK